MKFIFTKSDTEFNKMKEGVYWKKIVWDLIKMKKKNKMEERRKN